MFLVIIVSIVLVIIFLEVNSIIYLKNRAKRSYSVIDVFLKKRYDLIPNLVETVKGYAKHESETLEAVMKARSSYASATTDSEKVEANNELSRWVSRLFAVAESYPDLKANQNFLDLQQQLKEIEDKIGYARQFYNDSVMAYNNKIQVFPNNIAAGILGFRAEKFFEANEQERENVKVEF